MEGYRHQLPQIDPVDRRHPNLASITPETLSNLLMQMENVMVVDCRFGYEFEGGHILGAENMNSPQELFREFLTSRQGIIEKMEQRLTIVFHCEFSQHRGPQMMKVLRNCDREIQGADRYP